MSAAPQPSPQKTTRAAALLRWAFLAFVVAAVVAADQLSKAYATAHLQWGESWIPLEAVRPFFRFTLTHNTGAAFGLFPQGGTLFLLIALVVAAVILYYYRQLPPQAWLVRLALGLQLGGALGNVVDRLRQGYVVDFLEVPHWPVFNVADSCIVVGVALLGWVLWREERRAARAAEANPEGEDYAESSQQNALSG